MIEPNSNERIAFSSPVTPSSLYYITLQLGGQRGNIAAGQTKSPGSDGAKSSRVTDDLSTRSEMVNALHRPDGLVTFYHARKDSAGQKRGPSWDAWGQ